MSATEVADVLGVLLTAGVLVAVMALVSAAVDRGARRRLAAVVAGNGTVLAAGIALGATVGSLWFSEGAGFPPCELCWYQRIAMYPLVIVLGVAGLRASATGRLTGLLLAAAGILVSTWHNLIETFPDLDSGACDVDVPCTIRWVEGLGFWTIPRMCAASFALITVLTLGDHLARRQGARP